MEPLVWALVILTADHVSIAHRSAEAIFFWIFDCILNSIIIVSSVFSFILSAIIIVLFCEGYFARGLELALPLAFQVALGVAPGFENPFISSSTSCSSP